MCPTVAKWRCDISAHDLHNHLQMAITSSFQIQIEHRLKLWTPDFPSFETTYGMHEMDFRKCSKSGCHDCHQECFFSHHVLSLCEKFALSVFMVRNSTESFAYAFWLPVSSVSPPFRFLQASYLHEHFKTHLKNILKLN